MRAMSSGLWLSCLTFLLKFLNYLQAFMGISIAIYSLWMLGNWNRRSDLQELPFPWFIYTLMGVGLLFCLISCTGYLAAGVANGCFLCLYAMLTTVLILFEAAFVADLVLNKHYWEEDLPHDATGEVRRLREFVGKKVDVFECVSASVVVIQAISFLIALILRVTVLYGGVKYGSNDDSDTIKKTLLDPEWAEELRASCK